MFIKLMIVLLLIAGAGFTWVFLKRPIWFWIQMGRRALKAAGLKQLSVPSPSGPQRVFVGGSGPVLLLLHGAGDQAGTWARIAPELLMRHTLVIPDLAGHGDSAPASGVIETAAIVAGLEAVLDSQCQDAKVTVIGNSLGGWMAMVLAQRRPERIAKVLAVNGGALPVPDTGVNLLPASREEARATYARLRHPASPAVPDFVLDDMVRQRATRPLARFAASAASMPQWTLSEEQLRALAIPVRLLWGEADQLLPLDSYARPLLGLLRDGQLIPIERCGHIPQQEAPSQLLAALRQAL